MFCIIGSWVPESYSSATFDPMGVLSILIIPFLLLSCHSLHPPKLMFLSNLLILCGTRHIIFTLSCLSSSLSHSGTPDYS